jgi:hypothetical protein
MAKEVKIIAFMLEHGPGNETERVYSRTEAEWEIAKRLSDDWTIIASGGGPGGEDLGPIGLGFVVMAREIASATSTQTAGVLTPDD